MTRFYQPVGTLAFDSVNSTAHDWPLVLKSSTTCEVAAAARVVAAQRSARMMRGHICVLNLAPIASSVLATAGVLAGFLGVTTYNLLPGGVFERGSARLAQVVRIMS